MTRPSPDHPLADEPSGDEVLAAFDGRIYRPTGKGSVTRLDSGGYGRSGAELPLTGISLSFIVGGRHEVDVETSTQETADPVFHLLVFEAAKGTRRYPRTITIERTKVRIPVNGRERVFTAYACGRNAIAEARIGDLRVTVKCRANQLGRLTLGTEDLTELRRFLDVERYIDEVTGLRTRRRFYERLQRALLDAKDESEPLTLCLLDIDDFKQVTDRVGQTVGDRMLSDVASALRERGEAFRLGDDEFALLLPGHDERRALTVAKAIIDGIGNLVIDPCGSITASVGITTFPEVAPDFLHLISVADGALAWAKKHGKNRVCAASASVANG